MNRGCVWVVLCGTAMGLGGCTGCDPLDPLEQQARRIAVEVCQGEPKVEGKGGTTECSLSFDNADLSQRVTRKVKLHNVGEEDITISGWELTADTDPAFNMEHVPSVIKAGLTSEMVVSFRPLLASQVGGTCILKTDAQNARNPGDGEISINLGGTGADNGVPEMTVRVLDGEDETRCCDLGNIAIGSIANCRVKIANNGTRGLVLDEVSFDPTATTSGAWAPVGALPTPGNHDNEERFTIAPGAATVISFSFTPTDETPSAARVVIRSNAPRACGPVGAFDSDVCTPRDDITPCPTDQVGRVSVDLRGRGANPPTCVARIKSVNGATTFDARLIEPLDDVELTAEMSSTSNPAVEITGYRWDIRSRPSGSGVRFNDPNSPTPRFVFDNSSTNIISGLDVVGEYVVRCVAIDSVGTESVNEGDAVLSIVATPSEAIHFQLVWDSPDTDVDLHLLREDAGVFTNSGPNDCYFGNCKVNGTGRPIWDDANVAGAGGNPKLDVDDVEGFGPENSNIDEPVPGRYKATVHYWSDHGNGSTVATLRVYIYGNLAAEYFRLINDGEWWDVGIVEWPAGASPGWTELNALQ